MVDKIILSVWCLTLDSRVFFFKKQEREEKGEEHHIKSKSSSVLSTPWSKEGRHEFKGWKFNSSDHIIIF